MLLANTAVAQQVAAGMAMVPVTLRPLLLNKAYSKVRKSQFSYPSGRNAAFRIWGRSTRAIVENLKTGRDIIGNLRPILPPGVKVPYMVLNHLYMEGIDAPTTFNNKVFCTNKHLKNTPKLLI